MKLILKTPSSQIAKLKLASSKSLGKQGRIKYIKATRVYEVYEYE